MIDPKTKSEIVNVVCTSSFTQNVDIERFSEFRNCIYDRTVYRGRCGYVQLPEMNQSRVTIFPSGKIISIGTKSIMDARKHIHAVKKFLLEIGLIDNNKIQKIQVRNIVAKIDVGTKIPIDIVSCNLDGAMYDPSSFSAMMIRGNGKCHFNVFANGKIILSGAKSQSELNTALFDMITRINSVL